MPFSLQPIVTFVAVATLLVGAWLGIEKIVRMGQAEVRAEYAQREAEAAAQAHEIATEAVEARLPAGVPGSVARLRKEWCRDC
jgi:hypothetical protein